MRDRIAAASPSRRLLRCKARAEGFQ